MRRDPIQHMVESVQCGVGAGIVYFGQHHADGGALHQRPGGRAVLRPLDEIAFPEPNVSVLGVCIF